MPEFQYTESAMDADNPPDASVVSEKGTSWNPLMSLSDSGSAPTLEFPNDAKMRYHHMRFEVFEKRRENRNANEQTDPIGVVVLPLPAQLVDSTSVSYNPVELGGVGAEIVKAVRNPTQAGKELGETGKQIAETVKGTSLSNFTEKIKSLSDVAKSSPQAAGIINQAAGALGNIPQTVLQSQFSIARNPHKQILFGGLNFRTFNFSYDLIPRNSKEAITINKICRFFKTALLADYEQSWGGNHFFSVPYTVQLEAYNGSYRHPMKFKESVLTSVNINYHPMNYPAYVRSFGKAEVAPSNIQISLGFQEIELVTRSDVF